MLANFVLAHQPKQLAGFGHPAGPLSAMLWNSYEFKRAMKHIKARHFSSDLAAFQPLFTCLCVYSMLANFGPAHQPKQLAHFGHPAGPLSAMLWNSYKFKRAKKQIKAHNFASSLAAF